MSSMKLCFVLHKIKQFLQNRNVDFPSPPIVNVTSLCFFYGFQIRCGKKVLPTCGGKCQILVTIDKQQFLAKDDSSNKAKEAAAIKCLLETKYSFKTIPTELQKHAQSAIEQQVKSDREPQVKSDGEKHSYSGIHGKPSVKTIPVNSRPATPGEHKQINFRRSLSDMKRPRCPPLTRCNSSPSPVSPKRVKLRTNSATGPSNSTTCPPPNTTNPSPSTTSPSPNTTNLSPSAKNPSSSGKSQTPSRVGQSVSATSLPTSPKDQSHSAKSPSPSIVGQSVSATSPSTSPKDHAPSAKSSSNNTTGPPTSTKSQPTSAKGKSTNATNQSPSVTDQSHSAKSSLPNVKGPSTSTKGQPTSAPEPSANTKDHSPSANIPSRSHVANLEATGVTKSPRDHSEDKSTSVSGGLSVNGQYKMSAADDPDVRKNAWDLVETLSEQNEVSKNISQTSLWYPENIIINALVLVKIDTFHDKIQ